MSPTRGKFRALLRLSEAARRAGVTPAQLHYYLMVGLMEPTRVSAGHQRWFDGEALKRISLIRLLNDSGYPLREIRDIFLHGQR
ncbi:MAG: helix-turn-helix domain-containing protein [Phycisphaerae bacterium]|nr:helix-turn-helix domain-containing protein [Phycisphaerae bacterium]